MEHLETVKLYVENNTQQAFLLAGILYFTLSTAKLIAEFGTRNWRKARRTGHRMYKTCKKAFKPAQEPKAETVIQMRDM